ncbi:Chitin synthase 2 [Mizuhopecten yessoensis]|uniref:chitin synthase n=1 Tax=Mizuhopecten yessoensis TaxID=6573 RepID=A0A210R3P6_MIZYE|nr:Chitin synthase 2 [Mizuhopecten yessoensis]
MIQQKVFRKHSNEGMEQAMNRPSRVYICTTMYQEAEHEMARLLRSLDQVMTSQKLKRKNIYIESHIFLDNGADGKEMKDFGKQLLSLVEETIELRAESGIMLYTPYGIQLHWVLECGTPLFIHLKDTAKVKAKKRWSQVMYMEYILKYRSKWAGMHNPYESKTMSSNPSFTYDSTESLDRLNDYYLSNDNNGTERRNPTFTNGNFLDIPDIILNHPGDDADDNSADNFTIDMASNDGSLYPSETPSRAGSDLFVKETPLEIHTQESTIFSVSLSMSNIAGPSISQSMDNYVLMTDADMSFDDGAVLAVVDVCKKEPDVGGVCGRTFPTGLYRHPILWLQVFEFAKDFWMIKSSQNVIGSVMCCPGCFSLFRFEALSDIFSTYSSPTETVMDVFTKDNGEDRWMCTLMMLKGWKLRYTQAGQNSTFCPETTLEFMKQRRRWLLSDYTNALLVIQNVANLMTINSAFSLTYVLYVVQLFLIMVLYPGATVMMLSLGLELGSGLPLVAITPTFYLLIVGYSIVLVKDISASVQLVICKLLIVVLGVGTLYVFGSTAVIIMQALINDYNHQELGHIEYLLILSLAATYLLAAIVHPSELKILLYGIPYMFFLPLLNIILPIYAMCNIVDQSWGTRDNQLAKVPKFLSLPKLKKRKRKKKTRSLSHKGSYTSLNSSVLDLQNFNEDEDSFWERVVKNLIGVNVPGGMSSDERTEGLRVMRKKVVIWFLSINAVWVIILCGCYGFLLQLMDNKTIFSVVMISSLGLTPLIQVTGMLVDRGCVLFRLIRKYL